MWGFSMGFFFEGFEAFFFVGALFPCFYSSVCECFGSGGGCSVCCLDVVHTQIIAWTTVLNHFSSPPPQKNSLLYARISTYCLLTDRAPIHPTPRQKTPNLHEQHQPNASPQHRESYTHILFISSPTLHIPSTPHSKNQRSPSPLIFSY